MAEQQRRVSHKVVLEVFNEILVLDVAEYEHDGSKESTEWPLVANSKYKRRRRKTKTIVVARWAGVSRTTTRKD